MHTPWPHDLEATYRDSWVALTRLAYLLCGDRAAAEEIVQDAFIAASRRWHDIANPGGYLRTAVVNGVRDRGRRNEVAERLRPPPAEPTIDHPDELWDALGRLDQRRRSAVVLRFYLDLTDGEIAEALGCRPATVRTLIHRALRDLRREMPR